MARARKTRRRRHPGVTLIKPNAARRTGWRARYIDPDSRKPKWETLDAALTTLEQREAWALRKSRALAQRRLDLEGGAARATGTPLADAIERYYIGHPQLRERTEEVYRAATDKLVRWARGSRIQSADDLNRARLLAFRESLIDEPKHEVARRGKRGAKVPTDTERRSAHTVNKELRAVRAVLGYLLDLDLLPKLTRDDLRRALKRLPAPTDRLDYLTPKQLQKLLEAAQRHDGATFNETRDEHAGHRLAGSTPRYEPVGPFVAFCLLTGMRFGEAIALDWQDVDLDALDSTGKAVGEVYVTSASKTARARTVGLEVSPTLRRLLIAQKLRTGGTGSVFGLTRETARAAGKRLRTPAPKTEDDPIGFGAPKAFGWQALRRTCGTYLTNAPGIYGGASAFMSARQLGHSVTIAERNYVGLLRGIPPEARTLEAAMQIEQQLKELTTRSGQPRSKRATG